MPGMNKVARVGRAMRRSGVAAASARISRSLPMLLVTQELCAVTAHQDAMLVTETHSVSWYFFR